MGRFDHVRVNGQFEVVDYMQGSTYGGTRNKLAPIAVVYDATLANLIVDQLNKSNPTTFKRRED